MAERQKHFDEEFVAVRVECFHAVAVSESVASVAKASAVHVILAFLVGDAGVAVTDSEFRTEAFTLGISSIKSS